VLVAGLAPKHGWAASGDDGVNVWVYLPPGVESFEVVERAAALGVLTAPGEPFFVRPGRSDVIRMNAGSVEPTRASAAAEAVVEAVLTTTAATAIPVTV
jgi:DNA-binding transcriptional MocR family regulator